MRVDYSLQKEAARLRSSWEFGPTDPIRLPSLILKLNIIAVFKPLSTKFSGMAYKTDNQRFMLINSEHAIGRQNFTMCHELYHLFVQTDFTIHSCIIESFDRKDKEEYDANLFASYFLLPEDGVISLIPGDELKKNKVKIQTILKIEQFYRCSRMAILYRLKSLDLIDSPDYDQFKYNVAKTAMLFGYDTSLYKPGHHGQVIGDYGVLAKKLFDAEKISESHYLSLLKDIGIDIDANNE